MRAAQIIAIMGLSVSVGACATGVPVTQRIAFGVTMASGEGGSGVVAGEARVVAEKVNPRVPVEVSVETGTVAVHFAQGRERGTLVRLDGTGTPVSSEESVPAGAPRAPTAGPVRVVLEHGRFIVCFRRGDTERGYRLMAQAWTADGSPLGEPVQVSPPDADVYSAPQVVAVDARRAMATFPAFSDGRFALFAVPLELL